MSRNRVGGRIVFILMVSAALLLSCGKKGTEVPAPAESASRGTWFVLNDGRLVPVSALAEGAGGAESPADFGSSGGPESVGTTMKPWTLQERVSGFLQMDSKLYIAVNGYGFLVTEANQPDFSDANPIFDRGLLSGKTMGRIFCRGGAGFVQVHQDTVLTAGTTLPPVSLVIVSPDQPGLKPLSFPLQQREAGWEIVDILKSDTGWYCAWKKREPDKVLFQYSENALEGKRIRDMNKEQFFSEYGFLEFVSANPALAGGLRPFLPAPESGLFYHIIVSSPFTPEEERYYWGDNALLERGDVELVTLKVFSAEGYRTALLPDGALIRVPREPDRSAVRMTLPPLPAGYEYGDIWTGVDAAVISWEKRDFTDVGASGIFYYPFD